MSTIRSLFSTKRQIDRRIEKVIDYSAVASERLKAEIDEYEATDNVEACFRKFLDNYRIGVESSQVTEIGVWTSGFYGSGKSSFTKYLGLALDPDIKIGDQAFIDLLSERLHSNEVKALLRTVAKKAPTAVVFLDLGAEQLAENAAAPVSTVLYWKVLQLAGYSKDKKLAQLELTLDRRGKLEEFKGLYRERWNEDWYDIHNDPLIGNARAAQIVPKILPQDFPTPESFSRLKFELADNLRDRAQEMIDLLRNKTGKENILFLIDEAGQYVAPRGELILNLDGLVRDFKEVGRGKVWVIATGQQTLAEIVVKATYNSGELNKLQARFPITIELDARDIKEITYRRLLTKTQEGADQLKTLFRGSGQALITHTRLAGTALYKTDPDSDTFARFYPFLPQHFDLLLELIRTLARSTGGIGLRSAIKVIQDVLVDVNRLLPQGTSKLVDRPVGSLACADDFFDILRADIQKVLPHVVLAVDRATQIFGRESLAVRLAKAVAALQPIEGFPCTAENLAALLYVHLDAPSLLEDVRKALGELQSAKEIGLIEDPKIGGYAFLSDKVLPLQQKRNELRPTSGDLTRIRHQILRDKIFDPQPSAHLERAKEVKAGVRVGKLPIIGDGEDINLQLEWTPAARWEEQRTVLQNETVSRPEWGTSIAWLARADETIDDLLPEIFKSEQIVGQVDERSADRDQAQFIRAERRAAERNREDVEKLLRAALMGGTFIFKGRQPIPAAEAGETIEAATRSVLGKMAQEVFSYYALAPVRVNTDLAAKFLNVDRLDRMPADLDPLKLVGKKGGATRVDVTAPALAETLRAFKAKAEETGGGRLQGNFIQDYFSGPPYGWSKDTVRYLFAALLAASEVELHTAEGALRVPGPKAAEACKSTIAFNKIGVSLRDAKPDLEALDRAAHRLEELFGDSVLPLEDAISKAVRRYLPGVHEAVATLPDRLRLLGLAGEERARALSSALTNVLSGDATDAAAIFGTKESTLLEDIRWAKEVMQAFDERAEDEVRTAERLRNEVNNLDLLFAGEGRELLSESDSQTLTEALKSERFFEHLPTMRSIVRLVRERAQARYNEVRQEVEGSLKVMAATLEAHVDWPGLLDEDRAAIMQKLQLTLPLQPAPDKVVSELNTLHIRRTGLAGLQRDLEAEIVRRIPVLPEPTEPVEAEVEAVRLSELLPPTNITSQPELEEWLGRLRQRLSAMLRARKHIRFE